jgi:fatty-acyl-CoA synthase
VDFAESLPKTGSGKIQKAELRERYWQGYERRVH